MDPLYKELPKFEPNTVKNVEPVTGWFAGWMMLIFGSWYRDKCKGTALFDCKPTEAITKVNACAPEEILIFTVESDSHCVTSEALDPSFIPGEPPTSSKLLPFISTMKLPVTGARNCTELFMSGFKYLISAWINVVCVDGIDMVKE